MGASGGVATGTLLLVGNAGGLLVAILVGALVDLPSVAFVALAIVILLGLQPHGASQPRPRGTRKPPLARSRVV
jgi:hypothetical protein